MKLRNKLSSCERQRASHSSRIRTEWHTRTGLKVGCESLTCSGLIVTHSPMTRSPMIGGGDLGAVLGTAANVAVRSVVFVPTGYHVPGAGNASRYAIVKALKKQFHMGRILSR